LLRAAVVNRFCAPLCDALGADGPFEKRQGGAAELIAQLRRDNVFIIDCHDWAGQAEVKLHEPKDGPRWPCVYLWKSMTVLYSGQITLCCMDIKGAEAVGNAREQTLREVARGAAMRAIRAAHRAHRYDAVKLCSGCSLNRMWSLYE
jgi:hypothetical protein